MAPTSLRRPRFCSVLTSCAASCVFFEGAFERSAMVSAVSGGAQVP